VNKKDKEDKKIEDQKGHIFEDMIKSIKGLNDQELTMEGVKFQIIKLSPFDGFRLFEDIRYALFTNADSAQAEPESALLFYKAILTLKPSVIEGFRDRLFKNVQFRGNGVETGWMPIDGSEDMAFNKMEFIHIYELLVRCLAVNFTGSFHAIISKFPGLKRLMSQLKH